MFVMNRTHAEHAIIALVLMIPFMFAGWLVAFIGGVGISCIFFGREYAQAENRGTITDGMPWKVLIPSKWNLDSYLDFLVVIAVTVFMVLIKYFFL